MLQPVKDLLFRMKDTSELIVDLAYSAILFDNEDIAEEVLELERKLHDLLDDTRVSSILAARRIDEAEAVSGVLQVANATEKIGNAAGDIAALVLRGFKLPRDMIKMILATAEETIVKTVVPDDSRVADKTINKTKIHTMTGMRIIAIKRGFEWIFNPTKDTKILKGDVIFARGDVTCVPKFLEFIGNKCKPQYTIPEIKIENLERAVKILIKMKNLSELAVDLAYLALLHKNEEVAQEVVYLEEEIDDLRYELQHWVLGSSRYYEDYEKIKPLMAILEIAYASEIIADSARDIAELLLKKAKIHPILKDIIMGSDEIVTLVEVKSGSKLSNKTLGELKVETNTGMHIVAIKRGNKWITRPTASTKILANDVLVAKGTKEGEALLKKICQ